MTTARSVANGNRRPGGFHRPDFHHRRRFSTGPCALAPQVCPAFKDTQVRWGVSPHVPQKRRSTWCVHLEVREATGTRRSETASPCPPIEGDTDGTRVRGLARMTRRRPSSGGRIPRTSLHHWGEGCLSILKARCRLIGQGCQRIQTTQDCLVGLGRSPVRSRGSDLRCRGLRRGWRCAARC